MPEETVLDDLDCEGAHRYFSLEPVGVEAEGKVIVILVCTACGKIKLHDVQVTAGASRITE
jgi:hypothetical protein